MSLKKRFFIVICLAFILGISNTKVIFASTTNGTIDSTNKYAWGENIGWLNFGFSGGNVNVTDSGLTGFVWSENYGWINLHANDLSSGNVTNNGEGILGGNAWGQGLGWINFTGVIIDTNGVFSGYATISKDSSKISFNCSNTSSCGLSDFKVSTDWRPVSVRPSGGGGGGGSRTSCVDGMQNGTETGIDCGGICPLACGVLSPIIPPAAPLPIEEILGSGTCPIDLIVTDNMKKGDIDGVYSIYNKGIIKQINILQAHINRILSASYKEAAGPVDGILGSLTEQGVKRLQTALNTFLKPVPLLVIDGIVGPFTKDAINNSCGFLAQPTQTPSLISNPTPVAPSFVPAPSKVISTSPNIKQANKNVPKNTIFSSITKNINSASAYINTYIVKPVINEVVYTSSAITTILTNFWHVFSNSIINLFK